MHAATSSRQKQLQKLNSKSLDYLNYLSPIELKLLKSKIPLDTSETELINVQGERGVWLNKSEVLNWKGEIAIENYEINQDSNPEIIHKKSDQKLEYKQDITVRYLKPPTPQPGEIIINQEANKQAPPAPPLIIRQQPAKAKTPDPIIIREAPPVPPKQSAPKVIYIPGKELPPPPRKIILEKLPAPPAKPPPIIIERWLPYPTPKLKIIHQKIVDNNKIETNPKNILIEWQEPDVFIDREYKSLGVVKMDPKEYVTKYGESLKNSKDLPDFVAKIEPPKEIIEYTKKKDLVSISIPYRLTIAHKGLIETHK